MARTRIKRMKAKIRTFFELDAEELVELKEDFEEVLEEVEMPRAAEAKHNALLMSGSSDEIDDDGNVIKKGVDCLDLDDIRAFPFFAEIEELFEQQIEEDSFPSFSEIKGAAKKAARREIKGLDPKVMSWEDEAFEAEVDEIFRVCKRAAKKEIRGGNAGSTWDKAKLLHERHNGQSKGMINARCVAAFEFAEEWLDERISEVESIDRHNDALEQLMDVEEAAEINRGLRSGSSKAKMAKEFRDVRKALRPLLEMLSEPAVREEAQRELRKALAKPKGDPNRMTAPSEDEDEDGEGAEA